MFQRTGRSTLERFRQVILPPGGWIRTTRYHAHRLRRISDSPHRIARGVFAGTFVSFSPLFGIHLVLAPFIAWAIGGNLLAAFIATLVCNPLTFPAIAYAAIHVGNWILGGGDPVGHATVADALKELMRNVAAPFTEWTADWEATVAIFEKFFWSYFVGGAVLGILASFAAAWVCLRIVTAYQLHRRQRRARKLKENST